MASNDQSRFPAAEDEYLAEFALEAAPAEWADAACDATAEDKFYNDAVPQYRSIDMLAPQPQLVGGFAGGAASGCAAEYATEEYAGGEEYAAYGVGGCGAAAMYGDDVDPLMRSVMALPMPRLASASKKADVALDEVVAKGPAAAAVASPSPRAYSLAPPPAVPAGPWMLERTHLVCRRGAALDDVRATLDNAFGVQGQGPRAGSVAGVDLCVESTFDGAKWKWRCVATGSGAFTDAAGREVAQHSAAPKTTAAAQPALARPCACVTGGRPLRFVARVYTQQQQAEHKSEPRLVIELQRREGSSLAFARLFAALRRAACESAQLCELPAPAAATAAPTPKPTPVQVQVLHADAVAPLVTLLAQGGSLGGAVAGLVTGLARSSARNATTLASHNGGACLEALGAGLERAARQQEDEGAGAAALVAYADAAGAVIEGAAVGAAPAPAVEAVEVVLRRCRAQSAAALGEPEGACGSGWAALESRAVDRHCAAAIAACS